MNRIIQKFMERFDDSDSNVVAFSDNIKETETKFSIQFPKDYKAFLKTYGSAYTPRILDIVGDDDEIELYDIQNLSSLSDINKDQELMWKGGLNKNLVFFGNDCMGNLFCFDKTQDMKVVVFDHDFDETEEISDTFTGLIEQYINL